MKRVLFLTVLFVFAWAVAAFAATSDSESATVTCTVDSMCDIDWGDGNLNFGTLVYDDVFVNHYKDLTQTNVMTGYANFDYIVEGAFDDTGDGDGHDYTLKYYDGDSYENFDTYEFTDVAGDAYSLTINYWRLSWTGTLSDDDDLSGTATISIGQDV